MSVLTHQSALSLVNITVAHKLFYIILCENNLCTFCKFRIHFCQAVIRNRNLHVTGNFCHYRNCVHINRAVTLNMNSAKQVRNRILHQFTAFSFSIALGKLEIDMVFHFAKTFSSNSKHFYLCYGITGNGNHMNLFCHPVHGHQKDRIRLSGIICFLVFHLTSGVNSHKKEIAQMVVISISFSLICNAVFLLIHGYRIFGFFQMRRRCLLFPYSCPEDCRHDQHCASCQNICGFLFSISTSFFCQHPCTLSVLFADVIQFHHLLINRPGHCRLRFICGRRRRGDSSKTYVMFFPFFT